ncbi:MAG: YceI family protein [Rhizobiaceae bacterium]|nr:YceI family protein [Rhizobiaceae bacterium]
MRIRCLSAIALLFVAFSHGANAAVDLADAGGRYLIDSGASHIGFTIDQIAGRGLTGAFGRFSGTIRIDTRQIARSEVDIRVVPASVATGQGRIDDFLRSSAVFDADHEKEISFHSTSVRLLDATSAAVVGQMTARGKTATETFIVHLSSQSGSRITFQITGKVLRSRYGMDVGTPIYSNIVDFDMRLSADRQ